MTAADFETGAQPNSTMISRYQWLIEIITYAAITPTNLISSLGPSALNSPKYLNNGLMGSLPSDQWQLDVKQWWATYLASLQAGFVNAARGSTDSVLEPYKSLSFNSHARAMCTNQVRQLLRIPFKVRKLTRDSPKLINRRSGAPDMYRSVFLASISPWLPACSS